VSCKQCGAPDVGLICKYCGAQNAAITSPSDELVAVGELEQAIARLGRSRSQTGMAALNLFAQMKDAKQLKDLIETMWLPHDETAAHRLGLVLLSHVSTSTDGAAQLVSSAAKERLQALIAQVEMEHPSSPVPGQLRSAVADKTKIYVKRYALLIGGLLTALLVMIGLGILMTPSEEERERALRERQCRGELADECDERCQRIACTQLCDEGVGWACSALESNEASVGAPSGDEAPEAPEPLDGVQVTYGGADDEDSEFAWSVRDFSYTATYEGDQTWAFQRGTRDRDKFLRVEGRSGTGQRIRLQKRGARERVLQPLSGSVSEVREESRTDEGTSVVIIERLSLDGAELASGGTCEGRIDLAEDVTIRLSGAPGCTAFNDTYEDVDEAIVCRRVPDLCKPLDAPSAADDDIFDDLEGLARPSRASSRQRTEQPDAPPRRRSDNRGYICAYPDGSRACFCSRSHPEATSYACVISSTRCSPCRN